MTTLGRWPGVFARGMAMGVAEVVPGVSGGTIAFITGIYDELVQSIARFSPASVADPFRSGLAEFWRGYNLTFLAVLGVGMLASVLAFARIIRVLLESNPALVWAFFFGLIVASAVSVGAHVPRRMLLTVGAVGAAIGVGVGFVPLHSGDPSLLMVFFGGALAVSAWILPGISGSFILLLLGLYEPILAAVVDAQFGILAVLVAGLVAGLMAFSRLLTWLLRRWRDGLMGLLTGFMAGSVLRLWPWRVDDAVVGPEGYRAALGEDPQVLGVVVLMMLGAVLVVGLGRMSRTAVVET